VKSAFKPVIVVPSYNPGEMVSEVVTSVVAHGVPVWVMIDGSDDGSPKILESLVKEHANLRLFRYLENRGKGSMIFEAVCVAASEGITHIQSFDSDGQHPANYVPRFLEASCKNPDAMILGKPQFGDEAPLERVWGRKLANFWTAVVSLGGGIGDSLFGMRVYPVPALHRAMQSTRWARRFDFEPETAVRLSWLGVRAINTPTPVRYLKEEEGGVSHFRYLRDNVLLTGMYVRLLLGAIVRFLPLIWMRCRQRTR
jgi:glycosyltransferase involved in cell wall biosynthesis